ncbi:MAG TPA: adenylate/guanylate cyclase domain-containing protein [Ktedonobacteraceae bacterium]
MVLPNDWVTKTGSDLRKMEKGLQYISRLLHEHNRNLEIAVEGKYASQMSDPRVRLLGDCLYISHLVDQQLAQLNMDMQRVLQNLEQLPQDKPPSGLFSDPTNDAFGSEIERGALTSSISHLKQKRNERETLYDIARTLNSTLEFDEVLRLVMDRVITFVGAERGFLTLVSPNTSELEFAIACDENAQPIAESVFATAPISRNTVKRVIRTREPVLTNDVQGDDILKAQESILTYGIRSIMCAPLVVRGDCIGAVYVDSRLSAKVFEPRHRELLLAFCNQAAIAIDNARLFADLKKTMQQVKQGKQYMDNIFGSIANGVITTNSEGIVTAFNNAASIILRLPSDQVIGKHYQEAFKTLPQVGLVEMFSDAYLEHEHSTLIDRAIECPIPGRESDRVVYLNCYVRLLRETDGTHIGIALVIADQTDLKRSMAKTKEIREIFEKYVHPKVVEELIENPQALNLGGETKEISVVFADIRGYTRLSEMMPPEEVMNLINRYHSFMCDAIWEEEGTLTSFQGDALMAIFNAPLLQKRHALYAVRAAWKMRMAVMEYQRYLPQEAHISFGIGVNTGLATVGNVGAPQRLQNYTAIGDVVNVASRLQSNATDNNILLNDTTYAQVYRYVQVGPPFALPVKNKSVPLAARQMLGLF